MKIAIIDTVGVKAGMREYCNELVFGLKKHADCIIISNYESVNSIKLFSSEFISGPYSFMKYYWSFRKCFSYINKEKFNVVIVNVFRADRVLFSFIKMISKVAKVILIAHDPESLIGRSNSRLSRFISFADKIVVHNVYTANELNRIFPDAKDKIHIIAHPSFIHSVERFYREQEDKFRILYFGLIKPTKGVDLLLNSFKKIKGNVILTIAGRIRLSKEKWREMVSGFTSADKINYQLNYISAEERDNLFRSADLIVLPYTKVYQSGVALMAMSYGVPVLASDIEGNKFIKDGYNGFLFKSENVESLTEKIRIISADYNLRKEIASNAFEYLNKNHSAELIAAQFYHICKE